MHWKSATLIIGYCLSVNLSCPSLSWSNIDCDWLVCDTSWRPPLVLRLPTAILRFHRRYYSECALRLRSYLTGRSQGVVVSSPAVSIKERFWGSLLFSDYTGSLEQVHQTAQSQHLFQCWFYHLFNSTQLCLFDFRERMAGNFLKRKGDKTELALVGNPKRLPTIKDFELSALKCSTQSKAFCLCQYLAVYSDSTLSF